MSWRCWQVLSQRPTVLHFLRWQPQNKVGRDSLATSFLPILPGTAASASRHQPWEQKMKWKVAVLACILQVQLPGAGKSSASHGWTLSEALCAFKWQQRGAEDLAFLLKLVSQLQRMEGQHGVGSHAARVCFVTAKLGSSCWETQW